MIFDLNLFVKLHLWLIFYIFWDHFGTKLHITPL